MNPVTITMPLDLSADMIRAVRSHPTTCTEDKEEEHRRIGWLMCAWDVLVANREVSADGVVVPLEAIQWLMGEIGEFEPSDECNAHPEGYKRPQFWWRSEFRKRAGL